MKHREVAPFLCVLILSAQVHAQGFFVGEAGDAFFYESGEDMNDSDLITLAGSAAWDSGRNWLDLTGCTGNPGVVDTECEGRRGALWFTEQVPVNTSWSVEFTFQVDWPNTDQRAAADGLALVLNSNSVTWIPQDGGNGVPHNAGQTYFAVEVDVFRNNYEDPLDDLSGTGETVEHLEVHVNDGDTYNSETTGDQYPIPTDIEVLDQQTHTFKMDYSDDPASATVQIDDTTIFTLPPGLLTTLSSVTGGTQTYVGIAARTGGGWARFIISEFRFTCGICGDPKSGAAGGGGAIDEFFLSPGVITGGIIVFVILLAAGAVMAYVARRDRGEVYHVGGANRPELSPPKAEETPVNDKTARRTSNHSKTRRHSKGPKSKSVRPVSMGEVTQASNATRGRAGSGTSKSGKRSSVGSKGSKGGKRSSINSKGSKGSAAKTSRPRSGSKSGKSKKKKEKSTQLDNVSATASEYSFQAGPPPGVVLDLGAAATANDGGFAQESRLKLGQSAGSGAGAGLKVNVGTATGDEEKAPEALDWEDSIMFSQNPLIDGVETKAPGAAGGAKLPRSKSPNSKGKNRPRGNSTGSKGGKGGRRRSSGAKKRGTINPKPLKEYKLEPPHKQG